MAAGATRALDELVRAGITHTVHEYAAPEPSGRGHGSERRPAWGEDAATALGLDRARIHKTLVAVVDGKPALSRCAAGSSPRRNGACPLRWRRRS